MNFCSTKIVKLFLCKSSETHSAIHNVSDGGALFHIPFLFFFRWYTCYHKDKSQQLTSFHIYLPLWISIACYAIRNAKTDYLSVFPRLRQIFLIRICADRLIQNRNWPLLLLRSEIPSVICTKLRTVAASNNRVHMPWSLYYCLFAPHTYIFVLRAHPVRGESYNQRNTTGEVATVLGTE